MNGSAAAAQGSGSSGWFHPFPYLKNGDALPALLIGGCGHCTSVYMQEFLRNAGTATRVSAMTP